MHDDRSVPLPKPLKAFLWASLIPLFLSLCAAGYRATRNNLDYAFSNLWFSNPGFDYYDYIYRFAFRHTPKFFTASDAETYYGYPWYYPAPGIFVHAPYYFAAEKTGNPLATYIAYIATICLAGIAFFAVLAIVLHRKGLGWRGALGFCGVSFLLSWPLYFAAQRGNVEGVTWLFVLAAVLALLRRKAWLAAVMFGVVGALKLYPLIFFGLLVKKRESRRWIPLGAVVFALLTYMGLRFLEPNLQDAWNKTVQGVRDWTVAYAETYRDSAAFDHSIFGLVKDVTSHVRPNYHFELQVYYVFAAVGFLLLLPRIWKMPFLNQLLFLSCAAVILPPASFDYTLCIMYPCFALLCILCVDAASEGKPVDGLFAAFLLLGIVFSPEAFAINAAVLGLPGAVKAVALLALMWVSLRSPLRVNVKGNHAIAPSPAYASARC